LVNSANNVSRSSWFCIWESEACPFVHWYTSLVFSWFPKIRVQCREAYHKLWM